MTAVSILIPVKNGGEDLARCLAGINRQDVSEKPEVVVVDSGSTDDSVEVARRAGARVVEIPPQDFDHGGTRNMAASIASGEILVFLSQDAEPIEAGWLAALVSPLAGDEQVAGVYGRQVARAGAVPPERYFLDYLYGPERRSQSLGEGVDLSMETTMFSNANAAMRRACWEQFRFAEDLVMSEDQDWARRVLLAGWTIAYVPDAAVRHSHPYTIGAAFRRFFDSGVSAERSYLAGESAPGTLRSNAVRYAAGELRWLSRTGKRRWIPYAGVYELAKFAGLQLGRKHRWLPRRASRRLSAHPAWWDRMASPPSAGGSGRRRTGPPPDGGGMRVLGFCDWYSPEASGGAERAAWEIYRRLGAAGTEVNVISATPARPHEDPGVSVIELRGLDLSSVAGGYFAPAPAVFPAAVRAVRSHRQHVLHANTIHYTGCVAAAWVARRTGIPLVVTAQLGPLDHMPARVRVPGRAYEGTVGRYILRGAAHVLAVSETAREHMIALGAHPERVSLAPNGVDHERFGIPPIAGANPPLVAAVGRLTGNKGPDLLLEAAALLGGQGLEFTTVFLGEGPMRGELEDRARRLGVADRVTFTGQVSDVIGWLRRAEIVVRSSYTEGLALAVLEAMAAGRCNVVSDIPPNRELIEDGRTGLVFRTGDAADLARALADAIGDPARRVELARAGQEASQEYTWDRTARLHAEAFAALIGT
jgi:rhamnosyltransferase